MLNQRRDQRTGKMGCSPRGTFHAPKAIMDASPQARQITGVQRATELCLGTIPPSLKTSRLQARDLLRFAQSGRFDMSSKTAVEMISRRRMLGILGAVAAFGIGAPAAVLTASEAEAQTPGAQSPDQGQPDAATERRQRHAKRRAARHKALAEHSRRVARPGTSPKGTGPTGTGTTGQGPARQ